MRCATPLRLSPQRANSELRAAALDLLIKKPPLKIGDRRLEIGAMHVADVIADV
jgi:hypothetical protein